MDFHWFLIARHHRSFKLPPFFDSSNSGNFCYNLGEEGVYIQYINHLRISCISCGIMGSLGNKRSTEQHKVMGAIVEHLTNITKEIQSATLEINESTKELHSSLNAFIND
ncbi:hypothetical protein Prudu_005656 [Prunus dulcis]|uniref:Uncharacterized protein n=1 Tax=Prunus dulcis TaxID=3755 RepID=A0A4Y1QY14_PRUDU|nr:hypothetical protein Prudu_005656 [Prunus dulcis]